MKGAGLLVCCSLFLAQPAVSTPAVSTPAVSTPAVSECPSLDADKLATLKSLVVSQDVHHQLEGTLRDLWGSKVLYDEDPETCVKYSRQAVSDQVLNQTVHAKGKWFGGEESRTSSFQKLQDGVYMEVLHSLPNGPDFVLAKAYVLYAKSNVFAYFWCLMYTPESGKAEAKLPSLSGVVVRAEDVTAPLAPAVQAAVDEAVVMVRQHPDLLGEIVRFTDSC